MTAEPRLPGVSVILCTHNGAERIHQAIDSVLRQTYRGRIEVVVVDDGSTDGTATAVSERYGDRVDVLRLSRNEGLYAARAAGVARSSQPLLGLIDDDDEWMPHRLEVQVALLDRRPEVALVHGRVIDVFPDGLRRTRVMHPLADTHGELLTQDRIATSTVLLRRTAYDAVGGYRPDLRAFGDWDLWTRVAAEHPVAHVDEVVAEATMREGSIQRSDPSVFAERRARVLELRRSELERHGKVHLALARHHYAVASKHARVGARRRAALAALRSLSHRPSAAALSLLGLTFLPGRAGNGAVRLLRRRRVAW